MHPIPHNLGFIVIIKISNTPCDLELNRVFHLNIYHKSIYIKKLNTVLYFQSRRNFTAKLQDCNTKGIHMKELLLGNRGKNE